jgi:lambda family phage portal protein
LNPLMRVLPAKPAPGAIGGAIEGADQFSRETALWRPSFASPDNAINPVKPLLDARGKDMVANDGYAAGAIAIHKDSIVGAQFRLNAKPSWRALGASPEWAEEFQAVVEERFDLAAESPACWFDASRMNTFTGLVRLAVGVYTVTGEVLGTAEWIRETDRPFRTAIQMISPDRLCNPDGEADTRFLRRGVERDARGKPVAYHLRTTYPFDLYAEEILTWTRVPATKPWGRKQVLHIIEQQHPDQSRGISDMVSVLKKMRMLKRFSEVTLQNAVVNATYAAAIESELPSDVVAAAMGSGGTAAEGFNSYVGNYLTALNTYLSGAQNIAVDGVKIPHFFPGTKLNLRTLGTPGGVGTDFEASLLRHIAAGLGVSYEELGKDYSKVSYSSARASITNTGRFMAARKKFCAERLATEIYLLWLEEQLNAGEIPLPRGFTTAVFYEPLMKEALGRCSWIGTGKGQIDEVKETQAAIMRIGARLSTHEIESARLGYDFREIFDQSAREEKLMASLGIAPILNAEKPGAGARQKTMQPADGEENDE